MALALCAAHLGGQTIKQSSYDDEDQYEDQKENEDFGDNG